MKRLFLVAAVSLACVSAAVALAGHARGASSTQRTIDLKGTITSIKLVVGKKNGAGGLGYISGTLSQGKATGRITGVCAQVDKTRQQCTFVLGLPEGQIILTSGYGSGLNAGAVAHEAIVGGTGAYDGARGQGDDREVGSHGLVFHLRLLP
jgi:hypothetical protein